MSDLAVYTGVIQETDAHDNFSETSDTCILLYLPP